MTNIQKWLIVGAVWITAIGILLGGLRGRYKIEFRSKYIEGVCEEAGYIKQDTWTGRVYLLQTFPPVPSHKDYMIWEQLGKPVKEKQDE